MPEKLNVVDIVKKYLIDNGYDGLWNPEYECGCELNELMPCDINMTECGPGYLHKADPMTGYDFMIGPDKETI